ncbi:MAG: triose-phosphate isomerase [Actinomycetia bacterium]|nr:triose-phosphate isomerase [Actinomycetes bacterium]
MRKLVAGNWKMFKGPAEARTLCSELADRVGADPAVGLAVCPPYVSLATALAALEGSAVDVFAQSVHWEASGAFTGEVSAEMLLEIGAAGCLVGHSERRQHFGETDETTGARAACALAVGLRVIACVGELEREREAGDTAAVLERQVHAIERAVPNSAQLVVAYEPVWAIGTGKTATADQAQEAHEVIKRILDVPVLYGGSVKPENAAELMAMPDVDGALVGGASLDVDSFVAIRDAAAAA